MIKGSSYTNLCLEKAWRSTFSEDPFQIKITIGAARGLPFLHEQAKMPVIQVRGLSLLNLARCWILNRLKNLILDRRTIAAHTPSTSSSICRPRRSWLLSPSFIVFRHHRY